MIRQPDFDIDYGPVWVTNGAYRNRLMYYDDDYTKATAICYIGHPLDFCGSVSIRKRYLRAANIDDLIRRREQIRTRLMKFALGRDWKTKAIDVHQLWAESSLARSV